MTLRVGRAASALMLASMLGLAGCSTIGGLTGRSSSPEPAAAPSGGSSWTKLFVFGSAELPPIKREEDQRTIFCPEVAVLDGTSAYRIARPELGSEGVSYQASVAQYARECIVEGNTLKMRVGVEGRLLLGPAGKPGTFSIPVRVAIKKGDSAAYSKAVRVSVTVPANETQASFTYIDDAIALPITDKDPADEYQVLVGFDSDGAAPARKQPRPRRR